MTIKIDFRFALLATGLSLASLVGCSSDATSETPSATGAGGTTAGAAGTAGAGAAGAGGAAGESSAGGAGGSAGEAGAAGAAGAGGAACQGIVKSETGKCYEEMFCKYGLDAFMAVNESIVTRATAMGIENDIGDSFVTLLKSPEPAKVPTFKKNLAVFLVNVYGGDPKVYVYEGSDMKTAHKGLKITAEQYDAFIGKVVVPALMDNGVPMDDITNCFATPVSDPAFKAMIVEP
jgi:hypothetical protein